MSRKLIVPVVACVVSCACSGIIQNGTGGGPGDDDGTTGSGSNAGGSDTGGGGGSTTPVFTDAHPRIYLNENKTRLVAALSAGTPTAVRFKQMVDNWVAGDDVY